MTSLEWVFLKFPGKLKGILPLSLMRWHSFSDVHWRLTVGQVPWQTPKIEGRVSPRPCKLEAPSHCGPYSSPPLGACWLCVSSWWDCSWEGTFRVGRPLLWGAGVTGAEHEASGYWELAPAVLLSLTVTCPPFQALLREDATRAHCHWVQIQVSQFLLSMKLQISSVFLRRINLIWTSPKTQP